MNILILPAVNPQRCTGCGICAAACPAGAIRCEFTVAWDETISGGNQHE